MTPNERIFLEALRAANAELALVLSTLATEPADRHRIRETKQLVREALDIAVSTQVRTTIGSMA